MSADLLDGDNVFLPEVQANHKEWGAAKRAKRRKKLAAELAEALPALAAYETKMRRAFNHWDKTRARVSRIERELNTLDAMAMAEEKP